MPTTRVTSTADGAGDPSATVPRLHRVRERRQETPDTWTLELEPEAGDRRPRFRPGQFDMLYVFGVGEAPISISGDSAGRGTLTYTVRSVGAVTRALCALRPGDPVGVRGPFGTGWPLEEATGRDVLLVAGGVGLAPLRAAFRGILANRDGYGQVSLLYGARSPEDLLFADDLRRWRSRFDVEVEVTVDHAVGRWNGRVGVVTTLLDYAPFDPASAVAMLCGPEVMMRFASQELRRRGVTPDRIHLSLERNMQCAVGHCGHCQLGAELLCRDGPVYPLARVERLLQVREL